MNTPHYVNLLKHTKAPVSFELVLHFLNIFLHIVKLFITHASPFCSLRSWIPHRPGIDDRCGCVARLININLKGTGLRIARLIGENTGVDAAVQYAHNLVQSVRCIERAKERKPKTPAEGQEEQNIYYVAVTRAKHSLTIVSEGGTPNTVKEDKDGTKSGAA